MIKGFKPIIDNDSTILILGSMPSIKSLEHDQYYAHQQNRFWYVLRAIYNEDISSYSQKTAILKKHGIALWDVIEECERDSSMDADIKEARCNDIAQLLANYPHIKIIVCNGKLAGNLYLKHFNNKINIPMVSLPSTSPANATYSLDALIKIYKEILDNN